MLIRDLNDLPTLTFVILTDDRTAQAVLEMRRLLGVIVNQLSDGEKLCRPLNNFAKLSFTQREI